MKTSIKFTSISIAFCLLVSSTVFAQAAKKPKPEKNKFLENKTFDTQFTEVKEKGKPAKPLKGDIVIKGSKVSSTVMEEKTGLSASNYHVVSDTTYKDGEMEIHKVEFEASSTDGKTEAKIEASVTNSEITGTVVESKDGKEKKKYEFTGTEKEKPGKKK
ncbi:MAG TPA: hypothetical protein VLB84_14205 [Bacteroidia bacterium]|jgi:hypothetical protein|nr:hypothetical protein [Bacteroidia bacterium]